MSAISEYLNSIANAVYGEQVRTAIVNAITQCYSDVTNPSLNTEAFSTAIEAAYEDGFLDIQEKSTIAGMTNQKIIYRYTGNETGYVNGALYYYDGTKWTPIGSALQIASSAALMTDQGAIYKYTGNESGYVNGALYYYNGTAWVALELYGAAATAKSEIISQLTEPAEGTGNGNIFNPSSVSHRGTYYNASGQQTDSNNYWLTSDVIDMGEIPILIYVIRNGYTGWGASALTAACFDDDDTFLGVSSQLALTNASGHITLKSGTTKVVWQINHGGSTPSPSDICLSFEQVDTFIPFGGAGGRQFNTDMLTSFKSGVLDELTEVVASAENNLVNPLEMKTWGYCWGLFGGAWGTANDQYQAMKTKVETLGATKVYCRVKEVQSGGGQATCYVVCYDDDDTWLQTLSWFKLDTTAEQTQDLPSGCSKITFFINVYNWYFQPENLCVSFNSLDAFEPYSVSRKIKPSLLDDGSIDSIGLYKKNIVVFGDSIFDGRIPDYIAEATKAKVYNAAMGGTSASDRSPSGGTYTHDLAMFSIAHAINTGSWATVLASAQSTSRSTDYTKMLYCSELDWSKVDYIIMAFGANDPYDGTENQNDQMDVTTWGGAMRYCISQILSEYPQIKIFCCNVINSIGQPKPNRTAGSAMLKSVCDEYHVGFIDNYTNLGINDLTKGVYLISDETHPTEAGQRLIAAHVAHELW